MSGDDNDLFGMLAALDVGNDVVAGGIRQVLRRECEMHPNTALPGEMLDQVSIFSRKSGGGNGSGKTESRVGEAIVGAAHRTDQRSDATQVGNGLASATAIDDRFSVGVEGVSALGFAFVIADTEEHDLAGNFVASERREFVEVVHDDYISGDAFGRGRRASAESSENDLLRHLRWLSGKFHELSFLFAAHPMGDARLFEMNIESKFAHLGGDVFGGSL